jgi:hypothetical protein
VQSAEKRSPRPLGAILVLLGLILIQALYLAEHGEWVLSHPVKGAHWNDLAGHGTEHPSDYLPDGYTTQNRDAILLFLLASTVLPGLLYRLDLLRFQVVALLMVICLVTFFALAILYVEQRYVWGIVDRRSESAELVELIRIPMQQVPRGHCAERIGLRLLMESGTWLMHLKCDSSLAYAITQDPPQPGAPFRVETGRDALGNRVLLALEALSRAEATP